MSDKEKPTTAPASPVGAFPVADTTGSEPMTAKQAAFLRDLCARVHEPFDDGLTRAQAQQRIEALRND